VVDFCVRFVGLGWRGVQCPGALSQDVEGIWSGQQSMVAGGAGGADVHQGSLLVTRFSDGIIVNALLLASAAVQGFARPRTGFGGVSESSPHRHTDTTDTTGTIRPMWMRLTRSHPPKRTPLPL